MTKANLKIAIDGGSGTGKSTLAKDLAAQLNLSYLDTGAMYRAVALFALQNDLDEQALISQLNQIEIEFDPARNTFLNGEKVTEDIRSMEVNNAVSRVSALPAVRRAMQAMQKSLAAKGGIIMDGRDIGTVVMPDADLKLFVETDLDTRTKRRMKELEASGKAVSFQEVKDNLQARDEDDASRADSPLLKAEDAIMLNNSNITREEQLGWVMGRLKT